MEEIEDRKKSGSKNTVQLRLEQFYMTAKVTNAFTGT